MLWTEHLCLPKIPYCDVFVWGGLWEVIRSRGWGPVMRLMSL